MKWKLAYLTGVLAVLSLLAGIVSYFHLSDPEPPDPTTLEEVLRIKGLPPISARSVTVTNEVRFAWDPGADGLEERPSDLLGAIMPLKVKSEVIAFDANDEGTEAFERRGPARERFLGRILFYGGKGSTFRYGGDCVGLGWAGILLRGGMFSGPFILIHVNRQGSVTQIERLKAMDIRFDPAVHDPSW
jgi:hypothetical protein